MAVTALPSELEKLTRVDPFAAKAHDDADIASRRAFADERRAIFEEMGERFGGENEKTLKGEDLLDYLDLIARLNELSDQRYLFMIEAMKRLLYFIHARPEIPFKDAGRK